MSSPDISERRRRLALLLKQLRIDAGVSAQDLGTEFGWSQSKVSKIENGRTRPARPDVERWVVRCRVEGGLRSEILDLASLVGTEATSWRDVNRGGSDRQQRARGDHQSGATEIVVYQSEVVPGLLQTPEYARLLLAEHSSVAPAEIPATVLARLDRQAAVLFSGTTSVTFIVTETAMRWQPGDRATTLAQLDRILALDTLSNIEIGVVARAAQQHAKPLHSFMLIRSPESTEVQVETLTAELTLTEPDEVNAYERFVAEQRGHALFGRAMAEHVQGIGEELASEV